MKTTLVLMKTTINSIKFILITKEPCATRANSPNPSAKHQSNHNSHYFCVSLAHSRKAQCVFERISHVRKYCEKLIIWHSSLQIKSSIACGWQLMAHSAHYLRDKLIIFVFATRAWIVIYHRKMIIIFWHSSSRTYTHQMSAIAVVFTQNVINLISLSPAHACPCSEQMIKCCFDETWK